MSRFRKLRVLILTYEDHIPPQDISGIDLNKVDWKLEYDVITTLGEMGHEVNVLGIYSDLKVIRDQIEQWEPHITFNLLDEFDGQAIFDQNVVSYLELLKVPYTGCNPRGLILSRDKALTKKLLHYHRIPIPNFAAFPKNRKIRPPKHLKYPLFVKSQNQEASLGISKSSIVHDETKLKERIQFIFESVGTDAIAEHYIEGRELYVGILGNTRLTLLPTWELLFKSAPDELPRIATRRVKWNIEYQKKYGITSDVARNLPEPVAKNVRHICERVYRALGLNGYARIDLRLTPKGEVYVLEANPNPHIGKDEDFADSAINAKISYPDLIDRILKLGLTWQPNQIRIA